MSLVIKSLATAATVTALILGGAAAASADTASGTNLGITAGSTEGNSGIGTGNVVQGNSGSVAQGVGNVVGNGDVVISYGSLWGGGWSGWGGWGSAWHHHRCGIL
ncbi:hypothetical protein GCM10009839_84830 [Catenulispora yoronensis]|uniref:Uncharacterized protein n=1 Tax=Catenulispora yoronensis TaxID=450799 RepID=A0ABN2VFC1_9ACTN